jgi:hypothetical protein
MKVIVVYGFLGLRLDAARKAEIRSAVITPRASGDLPGQSR